MHPFSKLRCEVCSAVCEPHPSPLPNEMAYVLHPCPTCSGRCHFAFLCDFEKDDFLRIVTYINQFQGISSLDLMQELSLRLDSKDWFTYTHPTIEACLNLLPDTDSITRTYLEHIYTQILE